jgi:BASS family bile acid:Na+ symporter
MRVFLDDAGDVEVPVVTLVLQLGFSLLLPIGIGMAVRARSPRVAGRIAPRLQRLTLAVIGVAVAVGVATAPDEQVDFEGSGVALIAAGVWTLAAMAIGWGTATLLRLPSEDRFTFLIEFSARNIAVASIVALSGLGRLDLSFFSGVYMAVGYPLAFGAAFWRRRTHPAPEAPADEEEPA